MKLSTVLRWHAISAAPFALALLAAPAWLARLLTGETLTQAGIDFTRLYGAACVLITLLAWSASRSAHAATQVLVSRAFFYYESLGFLIGLGLHFGGPVDPARWLTIGAYGLFAAWYGYLLFVKKAAGEA